MLGGCLLDRHIDSEKRLLKITADYREETSGLVDLLKKEDVFVEVKKVLYDDRKAG